MSRAMQAKIHTLKKEIGLDDEVYRIILTTQTGQDSTKGMTKAQMSKVIEYLCTQAGKEHPGKNRQQLLDEINALLKAQKKHENYAKSILARVNPDKKFSTATEFELGLVVNALELQAKREGCVTQ